MSESPRDMFRVHQLASRIDETISPLLAGGTAHRRIMLIDPPAHPNVGDTAILLGELAFLRRALPGATVGAVAHNAYTPRMDEEIERADLLLFHGGGNFGDLWPHHHEFRLRIIERFPHKPMLQFPQSIHFREAGLLERTQRAIEATQQFVLLARDDKTYAFATGALPCEVELCPDMAFSLGPLEGRSATVDYACLLRTDKELLEAKSSAISASLTEVGTTFSIDDWIRGPIPINRLYTALTMMVRNARPAVMAARLTLDIFELYARSRVRFGLSLLGRGRAVVTDRLHGYILATMLGKPRYFFDTLDGKLRAFHQTWLADDPDSRFMNNAAEFCHLLRSRSVAVA